VLSASAIVSTQRTFTSDVFAQPPSHANHAAGPLHLNHQRGQPFDPLIDGSQDPESVPDSVAIRTFMQTLRVPPNPDATTRGQLRARVSSINLSDPDFDILVAKLRELDTRARSQQAIVDAVRPSSPEPGHAAIARYVQEQEKLGSIIGDHYQQILASLSPVGSADLQEHLLHIKSRIKIYPTPNMSPDAHESGETP
jgi:hypothetical protein